MAGVVAAMVLLAAGLVAYLRPAAVFIGDSYTAGAGATEASRGSANLIAQQQGWRPVVLGRGGTGYVSSIEPGQDACGFDYCPSFREMISRAAAANPDVIVVSGGRNETGIAMTARWIQGVESFYAELRRSVPDATIIATSPIWDNEPVPAEAPAMREVVAQAVAGAGGTYVDLHDPLLGKPELLSGDGIHPNDAGHAAIADAFTAAYPGSG